MAKTLGEENSPMEEEDEVILLEDENVNNTHKEPPKIHRLEESVVNRIAAGEVIQRPVNAVKELIENSLDAGSSTISVAVKDGGLKLIQVSDDGHGIRFEDLPILCERHTTSKLSKFEDLLTIQSMGFRGEALASMTYVGHVTVTTITPGELHGYRVSYRDGVMEHEPKPCAAVKGTQIMIENLFYNMTARRKTLQNSADDYSKIVDLLSRFAIHHINVGISCRKHGAGRADVHTVATSSQLDAIRSVYGVSVARNLIKIEASDNDPSGSVFDMKGFISDSNYVAKKITMVLFINDRLVECSPLKRAIEIVYAATLPKASKPFVYMSIKLPSEHVDVNIHPTKREVSLLNQEVIIEKIQSEVELQLINSNETRTFQEQVMQPSPSLLTRTSKDIHASSSVPGGAASTSKLEKVPVNKMVRTSSQDPAGRLHAYMQVKPSSQLERNTSLNSIRSSIRQRRNPRESADLTSIQELIDEIDNNCHSGLLDIVKDCTYVGMADDEFALLQYKTHLYLANVVNLSKELMYQQVLRRFAHFNAIQLSDPAPLPDLIMLALKEEGLDADCSEDDNLKEKIAEMNTELLKEKAVMLEEYFCIYIDPQGNLSRLPVILDQYTPDMDRVPEFALCLGNDVDWDDEKSCFQTISAALANFYAMHPPMLPNPSGEGLEHYKRKPATVSPVEESSSKKSDASAVAQNEIEHELLAEAETAWAQREWSVQHVLFPAMRLFLKPTNLMAKNGTFVQICVHIPDYEGLARCGKSCRLRWVNYLRPDLKRGNFTPQEEETIIKLHEELGNKWSKIASKFPGRTDNEIKNVWNTHLKKRLKAKESKKKSQDSCNSPPTSTSTVEEVLDGSSKEECSEQNLVNQTKSMDETIEHSTSSSASCTSQELFLDQEMEDLTPLLDDLGVLSPIMVENTSNMDEASAILDKGNESNPLEELIEIPFEPNLDLWDLLDGGDQSKSADFSDVHFSEVDTPLNLVPDIDNNNNNNNNNNTSNIDANNTENGGSWWWLVYLENELGLEHNQATSAAQSSSIIGSSQQGSLIQGS